MLNLLLRLFALRPILAGALFGIPIITLLLLGLAAAVVLKLTLFVILPIVLVVWVVKRMKRERVEKY
jgi:type IV secretory pathway VirB3-like protein